MEKVSQHYTVISIKDICLDICYPQLSCYIELSEIWSQNFSCVEMYSYEYDQLAKPKPTQYTWLVVGGVTSCSILLATFLPFLFAKHRQYRQFVYNRYLTNLFVKNSNPPRPGPCIPPPSYLRVSS